MSSLLLRSAYILVFIYLMGSADTSYYYSYIDDISFSMIPPENVISRSKLSVVSCVLGCINEKSCVSIMYCSFPVEENVCLLARNIKNYNTTNVGHECQIYRQKCQNGGSFDTSSANCSCPSRTSGRLCQHKDKDCQDYVNIGDSGIYRLEINGKEFDAYCDMETDGGGWTVIQRRINGLVDFDRTWTEYENGFGMIEGEFWLGNKIIHDLTSSASYRIRIDMEDQGVPGYAEYNLFRISNAEDKYRLELGNYEAGNVGDSLSRQNGMYFSTKDADHDLDAVESCAVVYRGGWWYECCHDSNLNGEYGNNIHARGINWLTFSGHYRSLTKVAMKIKRV